MDRLAGDQYEKHGVILADLYKRLTPRQIVGLFTRPAADTPDRVEVIRRLNDERGARGLRPVLPSWMREPPSDAV